MELNVTFPGNLAQLPTAARLRAVPTSLVKDGDLYLVNELQALMQYDSSSVSVDDNATAIKPNDKTTLQAGRWIKNVAGLGAGATGPSNNTRATLAALKAAAVSDGTSLYDGSLWTWKTGNYTGLTDDVNIVKADSTAVTVGAWVRQTASGVIYRGRGADAKFKEGISVFDYGAKGDGSAAANAAAFTAAQADALLQGSDLARVIVPPGTYLMDGDVIPLPGVDWQGPGSVLKASANGRTFFKAISPNFDYYASFSGFRLDGNGKSGVTGFNLQNWRVGSGITDVSGADMDRFFIGQSGIFGSVIAFCSTERVVNPIKFVSDASSALLLCNSFDNGPTVYPNGTIYGNPGVLMQTGIGVEISSGGAQSNIGVKILGGYIQGFQHGVNDSGIGTTVDGVYFETNILSDYHGIGSINSVCRDCTHPATVGAAAYLLRNCDAVHIDNPVMPNAARTALFDVDSSNTNCTRRLAKSAYSFNQPTGSLTYLGELAVQTRGTFTPVAAGATSAGTATYSVQIGKWTRTGVRAAIEINLTWTGHTGTGALQITGLPAALNPATSGYGRAVPGGFSVTGPHVSAQLSTGTPISIVETSTAGVTANVAMAAAGSLIVRLEYDL